MLVLLEEHRLPRRTMMRIFNSKGQGCGAREFPRNFSNFWQVQPSRGGKEDPVKIHGKHVRRPVPPGVVRWRASAVINASDGFHVLSHIVRTTVS